MIGVLCLSAVLANLNTPTISCDFSSDCPGATIVGNAYRSTTGQYLVLTPNSNSQRGYIVLGRSGLGTVSELTLTMRMWIGSSSGADGVGIILSDLARKDWPTKDLKACSEKARRLNARWRQLWRQQAMAGSA